MVKLDEKKADAKIKRWQGIAEAAAKQSKRGVIPTVAPVMSYVQAVKTASEMDLKLVPYELAEGMPQTCHGGGNSTDHFGKTDPADGDGRIYDYRMADVSVGKLDSGRHGSPACGIF